MDTAASGRRHRFIFFSLAVTLAAVFLLAVTACGSGSAGITPEKYAQIERGMSLDQVEGILGTPARTHRTGPANNPVITWYYNKADSEGLLKISFENAKVTIIQPYDTSVGPPEE